MSDLSKKSKKKKTITSHAYELSYWHSWKKIINIYLFMEYV